MYEMCNTKLKENYNLGLIPAVLATIPVSYDVSVLTKLISDSLETNSLSRLYYYYYYYHSSKL